MAKLVVFYSRADENYLNGQMAFKQGQKRIKGGFFYGTQNRHTGDVPSQGIQFGS